MRHNKHSTETIESRFWGTISTFSIQNHHDAMEERKAEENEVVEKAERMGGGSWVECLPRRSRLPSADLAYPAPISLLPFIFFLSSSTPHRSRLSFFFLSSISPEFFFVVMGWFSWLGLLWVGFEIGIYGFDFFFFGLIIRGLRLCFVAEKMKEKYSFYSFRDKLMNPIWVFS